MFVDDESIAYMNVQRGIAKAITNDFCGIGDGGVMVAVMVMVMVAMVHLCTHSSHHIV